MWKPHIYLWKEGFLSQVTAALHPVGGHAPAVLVVTEAMMGCGESQGVCAGSAPARSHSTLKFL